MIGSQPRETPCTDNKNNNNNNNKESGQADETIGKNIGAQNQQGPTLVDLCREDYDSLKWSKHIHSSSQVTAKVPVQVKGGNEGSSSTTTNSNKSAEQFQNRPAKLRPWFHQILASTSVPELEAGPSSAGNISPP